MIMFSRNSILQPCVLLVAAVLPKLAQGSTYCVAGSPTGLSWPSDQVPDIQTISLAETGASLSLTPWHDRIYVQLSTHAPYQQASIRIASPGSMMSNSNTDTILDCGTQAVGISSENANRKFLIGIFEPENSNFMAMLPLRMDITVVQSQVEDGMGGMNIIYAFETIFVEEWMINAPGQAGKTGENVDVIVTGRGGMDLTMDFTTPVRPVVTAFSAPEPVAIRWGPDWTDTQSASVTASHFIPLTPPATEPASVWKSPSANDNEGWGEPTWKFVSDSSTTYALVSSGPKGGLVSMGLVLLSLSVALFF